MSSNKKKILFLIHKLHRGGGAERVIVDQINNLDRRNFDPSLAIFCDDPVAKSFFSSIDIDSSNKLIFPFKSLFDLRSWFRFIIWLRKADFDIIYSHLFFANFIARIGGLFTRRSRVIVVEHNVYSRRPSHERFANQILSHFSYRIVAVSGAVQRYLEEVEHISHEKIMVIYNGVNLEKYHYDQVARDRTRSELNLKDDNIAVISVGQVRVQKGYDYLVPIAKSVSDDSSRDIHFYIVGEDNGELGSEILQRAKEAKIDDKIHFLGLRQDIQALLSMADIFCMPSRWEGFGLAAVEAMACGRPVVVSGIETLKEIVKDGEAGLTGKDVNEMASHIKDLIKDDNLYKKMQDRSLERANDFRLERNIKYISSLFLQP